MDWHEVALGLMAVLLAAGGWVWAQAMRGVTELNTKIDRHIADDNQHFANVLEKISVNQIELLTRISGRWNDRRD